MKYFITTLLIAVSILTLVPATVSAQVLPPLDVQFESIPLFSNSDMKPLDAMTRWVRVSNNTGEAKPIVFEAINKTGCESGQTCLANKLRLEVFKGVPKLYDATLKQFYDAGQVIIDTVPAGATVEYSVRVTFQMGADDNDYQTLSTGFDLLVGFQGAQSFTSAESAPAGLQIRNEAAAISNTEGGITVSWTTNYPATSQVLYGLSSGGPYTLNLSLPNYGYPFASVEDTNKVLNHSVLLTGLIPGESYRYRVVSHASPATVSYEHEFTVPNDPVFASGAMNIGETVPEYVVGGEVASAEQLIAQQTGSGYVAQAFAPQKDLAMRETRPDVAQYYDGGFVKSVRDDFVKDPQVNANITYGVMAVLSTLFIGLWFIRRQISSASDIS